MSLANKMGKANYIGDPGLFGDIWGGIKSVGRVATGIVGGLGIPIVSGVAKTAGGMLFGQSQRNAIPGASTYPSFAPGISMNTAVNQQGPAMPGRINLPFFGAPGVGASFMEQGQAGGPPMSGYHWNKTGYYTKSAGWIEPFTRQVKNRRRNPGNMRALSRSLGRIKSAKKMAATLGTVTIRKSCK